MFYPTASHVVTRTYDAANRLSGIADWQGHTTRLTYDAANNLIAQSYPNTTTALFGYNAANQLTAIADYSGTTVLAGYTYGRDGLGQVISTTDGLQLLQHQYRYTPLNTLSRDGAASTISPTVAVTTSWSPNAAYELPQITTTVPSTATEGYDPAHELTSVSNMSGTTQLFNATLSYNHDGDRTAITDSVTGVHESYGWDQADRLITATNGLTPSVYVYNGDGLRMSKTYSGTASADVWDIAEGLPHLVQDGSISYVMRPNGLPVEEIGPSGEILYFYQDQAGSTRLLLTSTGKPVASYSYNPYGTLAARVGSIYTPLLYGGQYFDGETGLYYLRARYYDPSTSQFLSRDPLVSLPQQPYAYVADNPLNARDPSGQDGPSQGGPSLDPCSAAAQPGPATIFLGCFPRYGLAYGCAGYPVTGRASQAICNALDLLHAQQDQARSLWDLAQTVNNNATVDRIFCPIVRTVGPPIDSFMRTVSPLALGFFDPEAGAAGFVDRLALQAADGGVADTGALAGAGSADVAADGAVADATNGTGSALPGARPCRRLYKLFPSPNTDHDPPRQASDPDAARGRHRAGGEPADAQGGR